VQCLRSCGADFALADRLPRGVRLVLEGGVRRELRVEPLPECLALRARVKGVEEVLLRAAVGLADPHHAKDNLITDVMHCFRAGGDRVIQAPTAHGTHCTGRRPR